MHGFKPIAALMAVGCVALPALARADDDVAALRAELQTLKADYDARVAALESRIGQLETATTVAAAPEPAPVPSAGSSASAFNPAISVVLAGSYADTSQDPEDWGIAGFMPNGGEIGPGERSFSLGESEITFAASVDPFFSAQLTAAIAGEDEIEVEEAFFRTTSLPAGFTAKGGRFFSGFGYLNEVHAHAWDFVDQPLVYQAFFGNQRAQDGVQLKWIAPTDLFIELGAETGNGDAFPGTRRHQNGLNGTTLFAHVGGDLGDTASWRVGGAWIDLRCRESRIRGHRRAGSACRECVYGPVAHLGRGCGLQVGAGWQLGAALPEGPGRVHASRRDRRPVIRRRERSARGRLSQHAVRLVSAERVSVPAALARGTALRRARFRNAGDRPRDVGHAHRGGLSRRCCRATRAARR